MVEVIPYDPSQEEVQMKIVKGLISKNLSEPYSIYVYRYFIYQWPDLCLLAYDNEEPIGVIVCNIQDHRMHRKRGYIAMLTVTESHRGQGIAKTLVKMAIESMIKKNIDEVMLETEVSNDIAMQLYENMGFIRTKRMFRYYLNGNDAHRLILPISSKSTQMSQFLPRLGSENDEMNEIS